MFIKNSPWLTSLTTLTLSAALHALLLVFVFTNFPALGDETPKKNDEPRLVVVATILPEKKVETPEVPEVKTPEPPKPIPPKNKTPEPKKQKAPPPTPAKTRTQSDALRALPPSPTAPPPSVREAKDSPGAESFSPPPGGGTAREAGRGEGAITSLANVKIVSRVKPQYPQIARKRNEEGTVVLLARVQNGRVVNVSIEKSSGVKTLDASAKSAVDRWKFSPDTNATVRVPVSFSMKE